jgi:hypothetical protein
MMKLFVGFGHSFTVPYVEVLLNMLPRACLAYRQLPQVAQWHFSS